jgi:hypothetical protein
MVILGMGFLLAKPLGTCHHEMRAILWFLPVNCTQSALFFCTLIIYSGPSTDFLSKFTHFLLNIDRMAAFTGLTQ